MKSKGFTLVELLAVIVILAVIALIVTPIVTEVINKSEKGAAERSAENYIKAVDVVIGTERLDKNKLKGEYKINSEGNLEKDGKIIEIDISGQKPSSGTIYIENGKVTTQSTMQIGDYEVSYDEDEKLVATKIEEENDEETDDGGVNEPTVTKLCTYIPQTGTTEKTVGAQYSCVLGDKEPRTFYVLENIESSENISLIMDRNFIGGEVPKTLAWCINGGNYNTCKNINTKEENPLKHIQDTFGDSVEVSFPTKDQIASANNGSTSNLPQWLYDHLRETPNPEPGVDGYWTASSSAANANAALIVGCGGSMYNAHVGGSINYGVRPVITISKNQLG